MKLFLRHITLVILAATLFLVGSGVNYTRFCCSECSTMGINTISKALDNTSEENKSSDDCCKTPSSKQETASCSHSMHADKKDCCTIKRFQIDLSDQIAKIVVLSDFTWHTSLPNAVLLQSVPEQPLALFDKVYTPPLHSSRHLLNLKSVLLI